MELWEVVARENIRDLVARYNSNSDTGRFDESMKLFADDSVMIAEGIEYRGKAEIMTVFSGAQEHLHTSAQVAAAPPAYVRHHTATHQIDLIDQSSATGRCYFNVITPIGLDHWGRYVDTYKVVDDRWVFASRRVTVDGQMPNSTFPVAVQKTTGKPGHQQRALVPGTSRSCSGVTCTRAIRLAEARRTTNDVSGTRHRSVPIGLAPRC